MDLTSDTQSQYDAHQEWLRDNSKGKRLDWRRADLSGANLSGATLSGATLSGADLSGATLSRADLSGADLYGATLSGANLYGATLSGADLYGANLSRATLSRADLSGADLYGATLSGANLYGANLSGAKGIISIGPGGSRGDMLYAVLYGDVENVMIKCGCRWANLSDFAVAVEQDHRQDKYGAYYRGVIEMLKVWRDTQVGL